jgi:hypothetical protein
MRTKPVFLVLMGLLFSVGAIGATLSYVRHQQQQPAGANVITAKRGTLSWHAQRAKVKGSEEVTIPAPIVEYRGVESLDEAISGYHYTVALAQLVGEHSFARDEQTVATWYKFKVKDYLVRQAPTECPICTQQPEVPQELLPLAADEILVLKPGGTVNVDGVTVKSVEPGFPAFSRSEKYLLFLELDLARNVGRVAAGPNGVYTIDPGGAAKHLSSRPRQPLGDEIEETFGGSLGRIKAHIKRVRGER